jgi:hypothetical protein
VFPRHTFVSLACFCFFGALVFRWHAFVSLERFFVSLARFFTSCARFCSIGVFLFPSQALDFLKVAKIGFLHALLLPKSSQIMFPRHSFVSLACFCFFGVLSFPWHTIISFARFHFIGLFLFPSQALGFLKAAKICFLTAAKLCFLDTLLFPWHAFVSLARLRFLGALSFPLRAFLFP